MVAAAEEELVVLVLVLVVVEKVLLMDEELDAVEELDVVEGLDDVERLDNVEDEDVELELPMLLEALGLALLLLEDDAMLLTDELLFDEDEVVTWPELLDAEEDIIEVVETELDALDELDKADELETPDDVDREDVLDAVDEFVETDRVDVEDELVRAVEPAYIVLETFIDDKAVDGTVGDEEFDWVIELDDVKVCVVLFMLEAVDVPVLVEVTFAEPEAEDEDIDNVLETEELVLELDENVEVESIIDEDDKAEEELDVGIEVGVEPDGW